MELDALRDEFRWLLLERVSRAKNEARFYFLAWQPTLLDAGAVVRIYGRKGGRRRWLPPLPYRSLAEAWPCIRGLIRLRLRHGYRVVEPVELAGLTLPPRRR